MGKGVRETKEAREGRKNTQGMDTHGADTHGALGFGAGAGVAPVAVTKVRLLRRKALLRTLFLLSLFVLIFLLGPRPPVDTTVRLPELPDDLESLDRFIADSERQYNDIIPGAEKILIWNTAPQKQKTPISIVYLHGFSATRQETAPLSDIVAEEFGANLYYHRLTGHGRHRSEMANATVNDWLNDAAIAMEVGRRVGERVVLIACSTGGTLASWLALQDHPALLAVVLLAPNLGLKDPRAELITLPWAKYLVPLIEGPTMEFEAQNPRHATYWHTEYPVQALLPMMALVKFLRRADFSKWQLPTLVMISPNDDTVDPAVVEKRFDEIASPQKKLIYYTGADDVSPHVFAGDIRAPQSTAEVAEMIIAYLRPLVEDAEK